MAQADRLRFLNTTVFGAIRVDDLGSADHAVEAILLLVAWPTSPPEAANASGAGFR